MTDVLPNPPPPRPPHRLDYAPPDPNRPAGNVPFIAQVAIGFAAFLAAGLLPVAAMATVGAALGQMTLTLFIAVSALIVLSVVARQNWRWRGFLVGVLIGLGLVLLAVGLCFAMIATMRF